MAEDNRRSVRFSRARDGTRFLDEGFCHHCQMSVQFRVTSPASIVIESTVDDGDDGYRRDIEEFFIGICTRHGCTGSTVARRHSLEIYQRGDFVGSEVIEQEIVYPRRKSTRASLPSEVPEQLRKTLDEAAAIESLSPNACGFLAGRVMEQALRDRLLKDAGGRQETKGLLRRTHFAGLINKFVEAGHAVGDIHAVVLLLQGFRNFAAHPPQPEDAHDLDIDATEAAFLLNAATEVLEHIYVRPARLATMQLQLEQKTRGDALRHAPEFQISDTPRIGGVTGSTDAPEDDPPF